MIIYRPQQQTTELSLLFSRFQVLANTHEQLTELLIDFGEMEAAVADSLCPEKDFSSAALQAFRKAATLLGHAFYHSSKSTPAIKVWLGKFTAASGQLASLPLPQRVRVSVPEGFAYYGLYPESYIEAALRFFHHVRPQRVVTIGIRSIGTTLSAVVAAALEEMGIDVCSYTVRPRGHPFDRYLALSTDLETELRSLADSYFLIVDEGPGLSGSSFASTAQKLSELGIEEQRIVLFPSWTPDGSGFVSRAAQQRWTRHPKYMAKFEPFAECTDFSAGQWRSALFRDESEWPAVHPQHERRKYLASALRALAKFAGLGRYGKAKLQLAQQLAGHGFAPPVTDLRQGFLITRFLPANPLTKTHINQQFLDTAAAYLAYRSRVHPANQGASFEELLEMIHVNVKEALGDSWAFKLRSLEPFRELVLEAPAAVIDGRMMPHEWLLTPQGYRKVDGIDHHDDHFFPGPQNIAWDLAGFRTEFDLPDAAYDYLIRQYGFLSQDFNLKKRLPFYETAYCAYRVGYATMAAKALEAGESARFRSLAQRYSRLLQGGRLCRL